MSYYLGEIILFGGIKIPPGFLPCDGREIRVKDNPALYTIIMNNFGGTPEKTFCLPDLRGRAPIGYSPYAPRGRESHKMGEAGGEDVQIAEFRIGEDNLPPHGHPITGDVKVKVKVSSQAADIESGDHNFLGQRSGQMVGMNEHAYVNSATPGVTASESLGGVEVESSLTTQKVGHGVPITFRVQRDPYLTVRYLICVGNKGVDCEYPVTDEEVHDV